MLASTSKVNVRTRCRVRLLMLGVASGQQAGDTVVFAVPAATDVTTGPEGDKVVFVGRAGFAADARNCAPDNGLRPLQQVVLVDGGSGNRATRSEGVVVISMNGAPVGEGLKNGTRMGNLTFDGNCSVGGVPYNRYSGTVE